MHATASKRLGERMKGKIAHSEAHLRRKSAHKPKNIEKSKVPVERRHSNRSCQNTVGAVTHFNDHGGMKKKLDAGTHSPELSILLQTTDLLFTSQGTHAVDARHLSSSSHSIATFPHFLSGCDFVRGEAAERSLSGEGFEHNLMDAIHCYEMAAEVGFPTRMSLFSLPRHVVVTICYKSISFTHTR